MGNRDVLVSIQAAMGLSSKAMAVACGKQPQNMSHYLSGAKAVGKSSLRGALKHFSEWRVVVHAEVVPLPNPLSSLPKEGGIYALYDTSGSTIYVGQAKNLRAEIQQTLRRKTNFPVRSGPQLSKKKKPQYRDIVGYYSAYGVQSSRLRHNLEALLLRVFPNQSHNNKMGNFR